MRVLKTDFLTKQLYGKRIRLVRLIFIHCLFAAEIIPSNSFFIDLSHLWEVCFNDIGCFHCSVSFGNILYRPLCNLPEDIRGSVKYLLYTPSNPNDSFPLRVTKESIDASPINGSFPVKILIPGFDTTLEEQPQFYEIKNEFLKGGNYNVIIIDWTDDNNFPYEQALANGRVVGALIALLLKLIKENKGIPFEDAHLIGHSIGAHIAGWAGERTKNLGRITGCDPAGPYFQNADPDIRLDRSDANFVDVIHTLGGDNIVQGFGIYEAIGHVDFYPNGGKRQPGCGKSSLLSLLGVRQCDHSMSLRYFRSSINECRFSAVLCNNYDGFTDRRCNYNNSVLNNMGYHARKLDNKNKENKFYLFTTSNPPYCKADNSPVMNDRNPTQDSIVYYLQLLLSFPIYIGRGIFDSITDIIYTVIFDVKSLFNSIISLF